MSALDDRLHGLRTQLRAHVDPVRPPVRQPARLPARRLAGIAVMAVVLVAGAVALAQRHRGTSAPGTGSAGPGSATSVSGLAANRVPNVSYRVPSEAMEPTLAMGHIILMKAPPVDLQVGEIVLVRAGEHLVAARLVAVPGDTIGATDGHLVRNGAAVDEPYLAPGTVTPNFTDTILGPDSWWVMGDNRANSQDSRAFSPVTTGQFVAVWSSTLPSTATRSDLPSLSPDDTSTLENLPTSTAAPAGGDVSSRCKTVKTAIATAAEAYYSVHGKYPDHLQQLMDAGFVSDFGGTLDLAADTITAAGNESGSGFTLTYIKHDDNNYDLRVTIC